MIHIEIQTHFQITVLFKTTETRWKLENMLTKQLLYLHII